MYWVSVETLTSYFFADSMHLFYTARAPFAGRRQTFFGARSDERVKCTQAPATPTAPHAYVPHRAEHTFRRLRQAGRGGDGRHRRRRRHDPFRRDGQPLRAQSDHWSAGVRGDPAADQGYYRRAPDRSEEHTSELQSLR